MKINEQLVLRCPVFSDTCLCSCMHMCVCTHTCAHAHTHTQTTHTHTHTHSLLPPSFMQTHVYMCKYMDANKHIYICTQIHVKIWTILALEEVAYGIWNITLPFKFTTPLFKAPLREYMDEVWSWCVQGKNPLYQIAPSRVEQDLSFLSLYIKTAMVTLWSMSTLRVRDRGFDPLPCWVVPVTYNCYPGTWCYRVNA